MVLGGPDYRSGRMQLSSQILPISPVISYLLPKDRRRLTQSRPSDPECPSASAKGKGMDDAATGVSNRAILSPGHKSVHILS